MAACVFCDELTGESHEHRVAESRAAVLQLDHAPANRGHLLAIPRSHVQDVWDCSKQLYREVHALAWRGAALLRRTLEPDGLTMFEACRSAGWQDVFHLHVHVVPRWNDDSLVRPWTSHGIAPADQRTELAVRLRDSAPV